MKQFLFIFALLSVSTFSFSQNIVKDEYQWHDHRIIETEEVEIPVSGDVKVKLNLQFNQTKGLPNYCLASFTIGYKRTNSEYISYPLIIKSSSGKIYETRLGKVRLAGINVFDLPITWTTIYWYFTLDNKNIKYFTKEKVERMKIRVGDDSIDLVFTDETLTNYIKKGYDALKKRSKTKLPQSANPSKYNGF